MCLISKWRFAKKAKKDIVCYKVLDKMGDKYYTPYMDTIVDINRILKAKGFSFSFFDDPKEKGKGYIHTYASLYYAKEHVSAMACKNPVVFKCIIPKGTKYHISKNCTEFCSKKIDFESQIPSYEIHNIY